MNHLTTMRTMFHALIFATMSLCFFAPDASAQDTSKRVIILKFDTLDVDTDLMDTFYSELHERVDAHEQKKVVPGGDVSINEMALTMGCPDGPTTECLVQLQDFVEGDQLLFGSVQRADDIHLFTVKIFDFNTQSFEATMEDQTVDGDTQRVKKAIPALIDGLLYGDVGELGIKVAGNESYDIFLDGELVAKSSTALDNLPLGEHVVVVRSTSGEEQTQKVILTKDEPANLTFNFAGATAPGDDGGKNKLLLPGAALVVAGVAGIGFGTFQYLNYRSDATWLNDNTTCAGSPGVAASSPDCQTPAFSSSDAAQEYQNDFNKDYEQQRTRAIIGWSAGSALTVLGGALIYMGGKKNEATSMSTTKNKLKFNVVTTQSYQGLQLQGSF